MWFALSTDSPHVCGMAGVKKYPEKMEARFKPSTLARMRAVLKEGESLADLIREGVQYVIEKREREAARKKSSSR